MEDRQSDDSKCTKTFGDHYLIELIDCDTDKLKFVDDVRSVMLAAAERSNSQIVASDFHQFEPEGVSGVILISWSHFSVHTWPEASYAGCDIFTCGDEMDPEIAMAVMKDGFCAQTVRFQIIPRGI